MLGPQRTIHSDVYTLISVIPSRNGSIIAIWDALYSVDHIQSTPGSINATFEYIENQVLPGLKVETIDGGAVDEDHLLEVSESLDEKREFQEQFSFFLLNYCEGRLYYCE